jgi:hypothetical protein
MHIIYFQETILFYNHKEKKVLIVDELSNNLGGGRNVTRNEKSVSLSFHFSKLCNKSKPRQVGLTCIENVTSI